MSYDCYEARVVFMSSPVSGVSVVSDHKSVGPGGNT